MKFKIGDLIVGKVSSRGEYGLTTEEVICKVVDTNINDYYDYDDYDDIKVCIFKVLIDKPKLSKLSDYKKNIKCEEAFWVAGKHFEIYKTNNLYLK